MPTADPRKLVRATYTYTARAGRGRVLARLCQGPLELERLEFSFGYRTRPNAEGREASYAAATALADRLAAKGLRRVELLGPDGALAEDLVTRRRLPGSLTVPYIALGCALNRFLEGRVGVADAGALLAVCGAARYPRSA
ncbi:MAG TPA: hypothetical protein VNJ51_12860 [Candidatus Dormibacteraeota bacterium]|nr:hypothetical protein [Candidatus Dormibacteraeota bacterium]